MLLPRLARRFVLVCLCAFASFVIMRAYIIDLPIWVYALSLPIALLLTLLYWASFRGTVICPTCGGTGKIGADSELCYSCDGEGRVPAARGYGRY